MTPAAQEFEYL